MPRNQLGKPPDEMRKQEQQETQQISTIYVLTGWTGEPPVGPMSTLTALNSTSKKRSRIRKSTKRPPKILKFWA